MNKTIVSLLCWLVGTLLYAQPGTGLEVGMNYTFIKDLNRVEYTPKLGYQFGYAWRIKVNDAWAISLKTMFTKKSTLSSTYDPATNQKSVLNKRAYYLSAPVGVNYSIWGGYVGVGYEYGYNTGLGDLQTNDHDHALFLQLAYQYRSVDFVLKYSGSLNAEKQMSNQYHYYYLDSNLENENYPQYEPIQQTPSKQLPDKLKAQVIQLSLIYNFGKPQK